MERFWHSSYKTDDRNYLVITDRLMNERMEWPDYWGIHEVMNRWEANQLTKVRMWEGPLPPDYERLNPEMPW